MKRLFEKIMDKIDAFLDYLCVEDTSKRRLRIDEDGKDESASLSGLIQEFSKQMKESDKK